MKFIEKFADSLNVAFVNFVTLFQIARNSLTQRFQIRFERRLLSGESFDLRLSENQRKFFSRAEQSEKWIDATEKQKPTDQRFISIGIFVLARILNYLHLLFAQTGFSQSDALEPRRFAKFVFFDFAFSFFPHLNKENFFFFRHSDFPPTFRSLSAISHRIKCWTAIEAQRTGWRQIRFSQISNNRRRSSRNSWSNRPETKKKKFSLFFLSFAEKSFSFYQKFVFPAAAVCKQSETSQLIHREANRTVCSDDWRFELPESWRNQKKKFSSIEKWKWKKFRQTCGQILYSMKALRPPNFVPFDGSSTLQLNGGISGFSAQ